MELTVSALMQFYSNALITAAMSVSLVWVLGLAIYGVGGLVMGYLTLRVFGVGR